MNIGKIMKEAQKIKAKMEEVREELSKRTVEASSGGGMVKVTVNGNMEVVDIKLEKEIIDPDDPGMLEDLILAAVNEALRKMRETVEQEMSKITMGLNIPGITS